jgi:hypothetical protein
MRAHENERNHNHRNPFRERAALGCPSIVVPAGDPPGIMTAASLAFPFSSDRIDFADGKSGSEQPSNTTNPHY